MKDNEIAEENNEVEDAVEVKKKRMPQHAIDRMNRALEAGMTPAEMEDAVYREMFE